MRDAHGGVGRVDALAARSARAERVDPEVLRIDLRRRPPRPRAAPPRWPWTCGCGRSPRWPGTRCTRWTPLSVLQPAVDLASLDQGDALLEAADARVACATSSRRATPGARRSACTSGSSSAANSAASSPPVPARISSMTFFSSLGSFGTSSTLISASRASWRPPSVPSSSSRQLGQLRVAGPDHLLGLGDLLEDGLVAAEVLDERLDLGERLGVRAVDRRIRLHGRVGQQAHQLGVPGFDRGQLVKHQSSIPIRRGPHRAGASTAVPGHCPLLRGRTRGGTGRGGTSRASAAAARLPPRRA